MKLKSFFVRQNGKLMYWPVVLYFAIVSVMNFTIQPTTWLEVEKLKQPTITIVQPAEKTSAYSLKVLHMADAIRKVYRVSDHEATQYASLIKRWSTRHRIDPMLLAGLVAAESSFNPKARSHANAVGLTQVIAKWHPEKVRRRDLTDPRVSIEVGAAVLRQCFDRRRSKAGALACYNGAVQPEHIQQYVQLVETRTRQLKRAMKG